MKSIRKATVADASQILPLWIGLIEFHKGLSVVFRPVSNYKEIIVNDIIRLINTPGTTLFVLENNSTIVGYSMIVVSTRPAIFEKTKKAYIGDTFIDEKQRGQGAGSFLIKEILKWLKEEKVDFLDLQVTISNESGKKFWESMGFKTLNHYMVKDLGE
ncbi:MAG: GNAT family N-acetyltransferase [Bacteroidota bacterium]|nr:GNAT family N-acetyltransferase [Bacteroidota bacterium]